MDFHDVINERHMVREWKSEDISMEVRMSKKNVVEQVEKPVDSTLHFGKW